MKEIETRIRLFPVLICKTTRADNSQHIAFCGSSIGTAPVYFADLKESNESPVKVEIPFYRPHQSRSEGSPHILGVFCERVPQRHTFIRPGRCEGNLICTVSKGVFLEARL